MLRNPIERFTRSLTARIFLITALILAAACAVTYLFIALATPIYYTSIINSELQDRALNLANELQETTFEDCGPVIDQFILNTGAEVAVFDKDDNYVDLPITAYPQIVYDGEDSAVSVTVMQSGSLLSESMGLLESVAVTNDTLTFPFSFVGDDEVYMLVVISSMTPINQTEQALVKVLPYLMLVVLIISLLGALIYSRYITKPIVRLSGISQKMALMDFTWKCSEKRSDEIGVLGRNLDNLSGSLSAALEELQSANENLQRDIDRERELERQKSAFFSAASHELKTPITILKGQLSGMLAGVDIYQDRDKYLARALSVTNRMEALVQEVLTISRMEGADFTLKQEHVNLSALVAEQADLTSDLALQRNQTLDVNIEADLAMTGDRLLLGRALSNIVSNGLLYSPQGESVSVKLVRENDSAIFSVENSGAYIPENLLPHIFEAFYRVEASRSRESGGSGLGLYIVKMILERHGAEFRIENIPDAVRFTVKFSLSSSLKTESGT